jgi:hypothetical protein
MADRQLDRFELKISATSTIVPKSSKTAFGGCPIKPPALLEVIGYDENMIRVMFGCIRTTSTRD